MEPLKRCIAKSQADGPSGAVAVLGVADLALTYSSPSATLTGHKARAEEIKTLGEAVRREIKSRLIDAADELDWLALVAHPLSAAVDASRLRDFSACLAACRGKCAPASSPARGFVLSLAC